MRYKHGVTFANQHYSPTGRYSSHCKHCWVGKWHTLREHRAAIKQHVNSERKEKRIEQIKKRSLFGWQVQIYSIR